MADADAVYNVLIASGFKKDNVLLLTDNAERKPTLRNMKYALGTFLARSAGKDDTVIVYFAGHGAPEVDPRGVEKDGLAKYLIPSDADPDDLFSTALPMDDLQTIFDRIEAERVVAFLDSCYSGAGGGRTFASKKTRAVNVDDLFLDRLTRSKGRVIITAARSNEVSIELPDLGHGVFTYYLTEGLKGAGDLNRDGIVSLQELYEYVQQQVVQKSRAVGGQHAPAVQGRGGGRPAAHQGPRPVGGDDRRPSARVVGAPPLTPPASSGRSGSSPASSSPPRRPAATSSAGRSSRSICCSSCSRRRSRATSRSWRWTRPRSRGWDGASRSRASTWPASSVGWPGVAPPSWASTSRSPRRPSHVPMPRWPRPSVSFPTTASVAWSCSAR